MVEVCSKVIAATCDPRSPQKVPTKGNGPLIIALLDRNEHLHGSRATSVAIIRARDLHNHIPKPHNLSSRKNLFE